MVNWVDTLNTKRKRHLTIVIAEDEKFMRKMIRQAITLLDKENTDIMECKNGEQGWDYISRYANVIDVALIDLQMPGVDGFELLKYIRSSSDEYIQNLPVIVLTGNNNITSLKRAGAYGIHGYLIKPVQTDRLKDTIRFALSNPSISIEKLNKNIVGIKQLLNQS